MGKPGKNVVELTGNFGGDITHALSAWTSTNRDLTEDKRARIDKLLARLANDNHGTPFEKSYIQFLVTADCASHIHLLKHRVGVSINGESARYKELKDDKYYVPVDWSEDEVAQYVEHLELSLAKYHSCIERLKAQGVDPKRAKESARFYLPYGNQLVLDISFNFRSFFHFVHLRYSVHAQKEIRNIAKQMLQEVIKLGTFDKTLLAFGLVSEDGTICEPFE